MSPTFKQKFKESWPQIKLGLIEFLKGKFVTMALAKLLSTAAMGGFRAWLIKFLVENLFEQVVEPIMKAGFIKLGYIYNRIEGNVLVSKIEKAKEENNETDYNAGVDDIFN